MLTAGCSATERLRVERSEPAKIELPAGLTRMGVATFEGESGASLSAAVVAELQSGSLEPQAVDGLPGSIQDAQALLDEHELQALLAGRIERLEVPSDAGDDPGLIVVRTHVVLSTGRSLAAPPLALTVPAEERGEQPWLELLLGRAAREIVAGLRPRTVQVPVEWELADGWDEAAWERFASGDYRAAAELLETAISKAQDAAQGGDVLGALYYDLGLCHELLGSLPAAERHYDEALTLSGTELHIETLRALRHRMEQGGAR